MAFKVRLEGGVDEIDALENESLLSALSRLPQSKVTAGCRSGGCGICKVRILSGDYRRECMSGAHVSAAEQSEGYALSCRVFPQSDLLVKTLDINTRKLGFGA